MEKARAEAKKFTPRTGLIYVVQTVALCLIWACIFGTMTQLGHEKEIQTLGRSFPS